MAYYAPQTPQRGPQAPVTPQPGSSPGGHQYSQQYYQQPQNIYQQLGQSQPQPHLQRLYQQQSQYQQQPQPQPGYSQQQQPPQSHGFVQRPLSTSFQPQQQTYAPSHTPFQQAPPQQQQAFAQPNQSYQQPTQYGNGLQQPQRPLSRAPSANGFVPTNSYATPPTSFMNQAQGQMQMGAQDPNPHLMSSSSSMLSQQMQRRTPQPPPPVSPSALLAQQVQVQRRASQAPSFNQPPPSHMQMQIRQQPQAPPMQQQQQQQPHVQPTQHVQMQLRQQPQPPQQQLPQPTAPRQIPNPQGNQRPLPQPSSPDANPPSISLVRPGTMASRPMSMPPTATGLIQPISTSSSNLSSSYNQNQDNYGEPQSLQSQQPMSASTIPPPNFVQRQIQQLQEMQRLQNQNRAGQAQSAPKRPPSAASSPTKSRPLPSAPGDAAKRATIDLGSVSGLPTPNNGSGFNFNGTPSSVSPSSSSTDGSGSGYFDSSTRKGNVAEEPTTPAKRFPQSSSSLQAGNSGAPAVSRTSSMAAGHNSNTTAMALSDLDSTPKRRASPPKFSGTSSNGSSPTKEAASKVPWGGGGGGGSTIAATKPVFGAANRSSTNLSSQNPSKPSQAGSSAASTAGSSTPTSQQKFTPVWKRTIPDYPAPVFGYAAGMVAEPFAKPNTAASASGTPSKDAGATPKANKVAPPPALTEKERKKLEKEEKKKAKEEEKQRKKMAKKGVVAPAQAPAPVQQQSSPGGGSMLPYLQGTPPRSAAVQGHGQFQHQQHLMGRAGAQTQLPQKNAYVTPTRQIQVRGQPVSASSSGSGAAPVARYIQPLAKQESTTEEEEEDEDEDEEEDDEDEDEDDEDEESDDEEEDLEQAYQYEGSDYSSSTGEQDEYVPVPVAPAPQPKARSRPRTAKQLQEEEDRQYQEYLQQQKQLAKPKKPKKVGSSPRRYDEYEEQQQRPSPNSKHVKTRSSASDGFVVVHQGGSGSSPSGRGAANKPARKSVGGGRSPAHGRTQSHGYSNSEDDWEQLQAYESPPKKSSKAKGKGRRYEPSEEEEEEEEEEDEEDEEAELRRLYEERKRRGQGHKREVSERDVATVRKFPVREQEECDGYAGSRPGGGASKAPMGKNARERVQDIQWEKQQQSIQKAKQYQQQLKYDEEEEEDDRGRQNKKAVAKKASKTNFVKEILHRSRSRSTHRRAEPEDEEEEEEEEDVRYARHSKGKSKSESPTKKPVQPARKLVKKPSRRHMASAPASETEESRDGDDNESVDTANTQASATSRLVSKFAGVMKFSGGQQQKQPSLSSSQQRPAPQAQPQPQQQRQSAFTPSRQGFQARSEKELFFGIADTPPTPSSAVPPTPSSQAPSRMVRGEVNRSRVGLKIDSLDDPPPRSLRTPSPQPGVNPRPQSMYQYPSEQQRQPQQRQQTANQQQQRRPQSQIYGGTPKSSFMDDVRGRGGTSETTQSPKRQLPQQPQQSRPQSQGYQSQQPMTFDSTTGLPVHHQQAMQGYAPPPQAPLSRSPQHRQAPAQQYDNGMRSEPSTPRQQQPINIESPAPLKMANIIQMEQDGAAHEQRQEQQHHQQFQQQQQHVQHQYTGQRQQQQQPSNVPSINVGAAPESAPSPRINIHHTGGTAMSSGTQRSSPMIPMINFDPVPPTPKSNPSMPMINVSEAPSGGGGGPTPPSIQVFEIPGVSVSGPEFDEFPNNNSGPQISISVSGDDGGHNHNHNPNHHGHNHNHNHGQRQPPQQQQQQQGRFGNNAQGGKPMPARSGTGGLICGGCQGPIVGRIVSAMGVRWHPQCFRCTVCQELLEHVSSYENEGRPYCHLDYHENFAPRCYSCKTPIIEEQFISLDDPALGKRTYHMEHFFCAECGDPFLTPSMPNTGGEVALSGDGDFEGFTVYKGHPYCEPCHVRLRLPKCKKCKKSIRDHDRAVEALGGKWCWACFVCEGCHQPFEDPSFFQRDNRPYCEHCFSIILRNEM